MSDGVQITIILGVVLTVIFALGVVQVYGDTYTELIEIPIPDNIIGMESKKQLTQLTDGVLEYTITLRFHLGQNGTEWFEKELTNTPIRPPDVTVCPDRFYLDKDGITCYPILSTPTINEDEPKPKLLQEYEKDLERLTEQDDDTQTRDSLEYEEKLQTLKECLQGLYQAQGIQTVRSFFISDSGDEYIDPFPQDHRGTRGLLDKAIEECIAEETLLPILGIERDEDDVRSPQSWFGVIETPHGERAIVNEDRWAVVPTHETDSLQDHYAKSFQQNIEAFERMCDTEFVSTPFKIQQGCPMPQIVFEGESNNPTGVGEGRVVTDRHIDSTEGGGDLSTGWNMTPEADRTQEQMVRCAVDMKLAGNSYLRALCGTYGERP
jgi:hypothetical protein